jgi:EAL domain-containing protein (putative c-di-GMP-specific phosphodiesterase class I)
MNREAFASASIGIAFTSDSFIAPEALLKNADTAMYRAKANGKANSVVWNESMNDHAIERLELETDLRRALDNREIYVDYQPLVDLTTGSLEGAEALARWKHPTRGIVPPGMFIPIAEDAGMIISIGYWILEEACLQAVEWQQSFGLKEFTMSVNLSGKQLQAPDVVERVADTLERTGLLATSLKLEITESVLMANREDVVAKMNRLRALGVRLALDDFGTGYSSLSTLSMFPIDTLKIDRAFISRLGDEDEAMAVVEAIMAMSRSMKMDVTGEGVETEYQMNVLRALGCHTGQGYLFAKPLSVSDFSEQLSDRGRRALRVGKPGKSKPDKKAA